ncbi:MAG TPA: hypothetical protein VGR55_00640 [Candidatus Acidoferrum sp.]|nr:hypothetical protein [Candidatus Acidoferrum sp.]
MKQVRAIVLLLVVAGCIFLAYRLSHSPENSEKSSSPQANTHCDQGLWQYVYHPTRLQVLASCISVTGVVDEVRKESDGDIHILFHVDREFELLLNEKNVSRQHGDLILEPICQRSPTQADAREPCSGYGGPYFEPQVGQRYLVWGAYVYDADHGWNELHPVTSMQPIQTVFE